MATARQGVDDDPPLRSHLPSSTGAIYGSWRRSSRCVNGSCVEVIQHGNDEFGLRDSKQGAMGAEQPVLTMDRASFLTFIGHIVGRMPSQPSESVEIRTAPNGKTIVSSAAQNVELHFDSDEIDAFRAGIKAGEFEPQPLAFAG